MKRWLACCSIALALVPASAYAACSKEAVPKIPDGGSASEADMAAAQAGVKAYVSSTNAYLACVQKDLDSPTTPKTQKATLNTQYNTAVDEMQGVAAQWKAAITAFKSR